MSKVLIFGGTGDIGSAIDAEFRAVGAETIPLGRKDLDFANCKFLDFFHLLNKHRPDVVIHAAGLLSGPMKEIFDVNFFSACHILYYYKYIPDPQPITLLFLGSSSHDKPSPLYEFYAASKAALHSMVRSRPMPQHKKVRLLNLGKTNTKMRRRAVGVEDITTLLSVEQAAARVFELVTDDEGEVVSSYNK